MHELDPREAPFHVPPALPCLHWQRFPPPAVSIFASWDIREIPREKVVAYASPCSILQNKITHQRGTSLSFMDKEVFWGVALPKREESSPPVPTAADIAATADIPGTTNASEALPVPKSTPEKKAPKYAGWEMELHPSQPVLATGEIPQPTTMLRPKRRALQLAQTTSISLPLSLSKTPLPPKSPLPARTLALVRLPTPPRGFAGVVAC